MPKSKNIKIKGLIVEAVSLSLIVLFIYTALNKILDYDTFLFQLGRSPFLQPVAGIVSRTIPSAELLSAILLIFTKTRLLGLYMSFFLMVLFSGYVYAMLHYSYYLPCSCGGILASMSWHTHLLFNGIISAVTMASILLFEADSSPSKNRLTSPVMSR